MAAGVESVPGVEEAAKREVWLQSSFQIPAVAPLRTANPPKVVDRTFLVLGGLVFGLTAMDMEFTQYCLHRHTCVELDPALPHSHLGMYAVNTPVNLAAMYYAYRRRATGKWGWWLAPAVAIGSHVGGLGSNIRFLGK
jgi:hypothetical protein